MPRYKAIKFVLECFRQLQPTTWFEDKAPPLFYDRILHE